MAELITMPKLGFDMKEGQLVAWLKKPGDKVEKDEAIAEIESDKATVQVEVFEKTGTVLELLAEEGDYVEIDAPIAVIGEEGEAYDLAELGVEGKPEKEEKEKETKAKKKKPKAPEPKEDEDAQGLPDGVRASPLARRIAEEKGINLKQVEGTGPKGRIVREDVESYEPEAAPRMAAEPTYGELPEGPDVEIVETPKMRAAIGRRMVQSKQQVPHFYVTTEVDVGALMIMRKQLNDSLPEGAQKISVNDLVVKAAALALRKFPNLNSHFYGDKIARHQRIHVGIAVALPQGGVINVVARDADKTALGTLAEQNRAMIERMREGKSKPQDIEGATFAVSNMGMFDVSHFAAIITPPQAGVLAVGTAKKIPVVHENGSIGVGQRMSITISADHRVTDGVEAAEFVKYIKTLLETPTRLVI